jgi:hypothetical protein
MKRHSENLPQIKMEPDYIEAKADDKQEMYIHIGLTQHVNSNSTSNLDIMA